MLRVNLRENCMKAKGDYRGQVHSDQVVLGFSGCQDGRLGCRSGGQKRQLK
jgi:hypothetical protein